MRYFLAILSLMMMLLLSSCGYVYERQYSYTPPDNQAGKQCASQCYAGKSACQRICLLKNPNCGVRSYADASAAFEKYKRQQRAQGKKVRKQLRDFEQSEDCKNVCHCTAAYNTCYTSCGGQVH
jgi:hypothetical protein